jgi:hypothetical protein
MGRQVPGHAAKYIRIAPIVLTIALAPVSAIRDPARSGDQPLVELLVFDRTSSHNISV